MAETNRHQNTGQRDAVTRSKPTYITLETWCAMSSWKYVQLHRCSSTQMVSLSLLEMLWFRVHGGFGQLDDIRRSGQAPSDRAGTREVCPHSSISKPEQAALPHNVEVSTQDLWGSSTGEAIPSHDAIRHVASPCNSRSRSSTRLTSCNILNHHPSLNSYHHHPPFLGSRCSGRERSPEVSSLF